MQSGFRSAPRLPEDMGSVSKNIACDLEVMAVVGVVCSACTGSAPFAVIMLISIAR